jgi:hypothetical protein
MKVLDLKCALGHVFEGWFASEDDFASQCQRSLVQCPICGDPSVVKQLSAPRLLLSSGRAVSEGHHDRHDEGVSTTGIPTLADAWLAIARQVVSHTTDVGEKFAEEARKIHYGERKERGIRGTATLEETQSLVEEGIEVVPFPLPAALKGRLQ